MYVDLALAAIILAFGLMGLFQGVIIQLFRLGGLVAIYFYWRLAAERSGEWLSLKAGLNPLASYYAALIAGSALAYMICSVAGLLVHRVVSGAGETPRRINRTLGGGLGLLRGVLVAFITAAALDMAAPIAAENMPGFSRQIDASLAVKRVHPINPLLELDFLRNIQEVMTISRDEPARQFFAEQPPVVRLRNHPKVKTALEDPDVQRLIEERDLRRLLSHPKVRPILFDAEIRDLLNSPEMQQAIDEAAKRAAPPQRPASPVAPPGLPSH